METSIPLHLWLGLAVRTESDQPHEWPFIGSVILNRVEERRWPSTLQGVILEPLQFSAFNDTYGDPDDRYEQAFRRIASQAGGSAQLEAAASCAAWLLAVPAAHRPFSKRVCWFWSPRSMKPAGKVPGWATALRTVVAPGVSTWRFLFAEER